MAVQAVCSVFAQRCNEEAYRRHVLATHALFSSILARTASIQLNVTTPWKCDDSQQVIIAKMNASCERVKSFATSETYFLGEMTPEAFENMTSEMASTLAKMYKDVSRSNVNAPTPRKAEVFKRTLPALFDQMIDLMTYLAKFRSQLSNPFGEKDVDLLPPEADCDLDCKERQSFKLLVTFKNFQKAVFPIFGMFRKLAIELSRLRSRLDKIDGRTLDVCYNGLGADDEYKVTREVLKELNKLVAPGCQDQWIGAAYEAEKCLQVFVTRYTNHSHDAIKKLQYSMDKYVYLSVFLKSFCDSHVGWSDWYLRKKGNESVQAVRSLKDGMELLRNLSRHEESCNQATTKKPYDGARTTEPYATDATTSEFDHAWLDKVNSHAKDVIDDETKSLKPKSWKDRQSLHEAVANGIVKRLDKYLDKKLSFVALAYLPYVDDERQAFVKLPDNLDVVRNAHNSVKYVVSRRRNVGPGSNVTGHWAGIEKNTDDILEATFSTRATNLTSRIEEVETRFGPFLAADGFGALAAVRCGYEFVWYQLGYRNFPAGYATGKHQLFTENDNKYSDKCGQIVFFP